MSFNDFIKEKEESNNKKGIIINIEKDTKENNNFRKVIFTGNNLQLVLMSLKPDEDIGEEVHDSDQFFRVDEGSGKVIIEDNETEISDGSAFVVPGGTKHNVIAGKNGLKLYAIYAPPQHEDGVIDKTKEDAHDEKEIPESIEESEYKGKKVKLNDPFRTPDGPKKFSVYVKNDAGNVVKVNFGDPKMEIKRDDPERRKSFRARHNCNDKKDKTKAGYWSCYQWRKDSKVNN
jgi:mannose-6-phosphate isomerase-like protein (cupin superfamily)